MERSKPARFEFFCPLCCSRQRTNTIAKVGARHHIAILSFTLVFTLVFWNIFGAKAMATYIVYWAIFEAAYRLRKRNELICRNCGFDPFLYRNDVEKTRAQVKDYLQNRILNEGHFQGKKLKNYRTQAASAKKAVQSEEDEFSVASALKTNAEARAEDVRDELGAAPRANRPRPGPGLGL